MSSGRNGQKIGNLPQGLPILPMPAALLPQACRKSAATFVSICRPARIYRYGRRQDRVLP